MVILLFLYHRHRNCIFVTSIHKKFTYDNSPTVQSTENLYDELNYLNTDDGNLNNDETCVKLLEGTSRQWPDISRRRHVVVQLDDISNELDYTTDIQDVRNFAIFHSPKQKHDHSVSSFSEEFPASCSKEEHISCNNSKTNKSHSVDTNSDSRNKRNSTLPCDLESGVNSKLTPSTERTDLLSEIKIILSGEIYEKRIEDDCSTNRCSRIPSDFETPIYSKSGSSKEETSYTSDRKMSPPCTNIRTYDIDTTPGRYSEGMFTSKDQIHVSANSKSVQYTKHKEIYAIKSSDGNTTEHNVKTRIESEDIKTKNEGEHLTTSYEGKQRNVKKGPSENKTERFDDNENDQTKETNLDRRLLEKFSEKSDNEGQNTLRNNCVSENRMQRKFDKKTLNSGIKYNTRKSKTGQLILVLRTATTENKESQALSKEGLVVIEDKSIPDPTDRRRLDFLRHIHDTTKYENSRKKIKFEDKKNSESACKVAKVAPRIQKTENNGDNTWRTRDQNLLIAQPEIIDENSKVVTSKSNRPLEPEGSNRIYERSSSQESENSESENDLTEFPPVDSVEFDTNQPD